MWLYFYIFLICNFFVWSFASLFLFFCMARVGLCFVYPSYIFRISFVEVLLLLAVFVLPASTEGFVEMD